jgi:cytoskeleton protein RodZ
MSEASETLGQRLKAERERKGLSAQKAADELHLDGWVIDALESGDYVKIGPSFYGKGHLKRYAGLLGLPAAEILEAYDAQSSVPVSPAQPASMRMRTSAPAGELPWIQIAGFVVVAAVIGGVLWWRPWAPRTAAASAARAVTVEQSAQPEEARPAADSGVIAATVTAPGAAAIASPAAAAPAAQNEADANAGLGRARLRLSFSAESWVDVHDAAGQRVFAGTGRANSVKTIAGSAPLRVYLKSASGVQLEINNHAVAIGSQFVVGDVARFEAGADGVLRRDTHAASAAPQPHG